MAAVSARSLRPLRSLSGRRLATYAPEPEPEYRAVAQYPPILDNSLKARKLREAQVEYDRIQSIKTVEEKLIRLNNPRYYGFKSFQLTEKVPPRTLPFMKHSTRTYLQKEDLTSYYLPYESAATYHATKIRPQVEDALACEFTVPRDFVYKPKISKELQRKQMIAEAVIGQINRILLGNLSADVPHLSESEVDIKPRHEAFWFVGGLLNHFTIESYKKAEEKGYSLPQYDKSLQHFGDPAITLRSNLPLEPFASEAEYTNEKYEVPFYQYDPFKIGFFVERDRATFIPGFWPGDKFEYGLMSYHTKHFTDDMYPGLSPNEKVDMVHTQAILASFSWLHSQACYKGFSPYNDITYPLVTQTVVTDGQHWSFYTYQMNTMLVHGDHPKENPKRNICHCTEPLRLFDSIEPDGTVVGFNEDVLRRLIQLYMNSPKERENVDVKPFLGKDIQYVAQLESEEERRVWLEKNYKYLMSRRKGTKIPYEIYLWEYIYKIKHKTRSLDPRRRPFELFQPHPFLKKLDDRKPEYIPRALQRKGIQKKYVRFAKSYYP